MLILKYSTIILFLLAVLTLLARSILLTLRITRHVDSPAVRRVEAVAATLSAAVLVWQVGVTGAALARPDAGRNVILTYYRLIEARDFNGAWKLFHPARIEELRQRGMGPEGLGAAHATTVQYGLVRAEQDREDSPTIRLYWVSFNVKDRFPRSTLYTYGSEPLSGAVKAGLVDKAKILQTIIGDIRRDYDLPDKQLESVQTYVLNAPLNATFGPKIVIDAATSNHLTRKRYGNEMDVWSHYIQHLKLIDQDGWKIRSGMWPPELEAYYPPGGQVPSN